MKKFVPGVALIATLALGASLSSCASTDQAPEATPEAALAAPAAVSADGKFTVCVNIAYPPYEFFKEGTQEPAGSDIEIAAAIADLWGVPVSYNNLGFEGLIAAVNTDKCHAAISGMAPLPERLEGASFVVYQQNGSLLLVPKGNPKSLSTVESLSGSTVGVMLGSTHGKEVEAMNVELAAAGKPEIKITTFAKDTDAPAALVSGKLDAYFAAGPSVEQRAVQAPEELEVAGELIKPELLAATVKKGNSEMLNRLSEAVKTLYENGTMTKIFDTWGMSKEAIEPALQGEIRE